MPLGVVSGSIQGKSFLIATTAGRPKHPHPSAWKGGQGPEQVPGTHFPTAQGNAKLPTKNLAINQTPAFPEPHQRLCNKNRAVIHSLESCPVQTVLPCLPHPCHMLQGCGAPGGSWDTDWSTKSHHVGKSSSSLAHTSRTHNRTSRSSIQRSLQVHRFTVSSPIDF